uniref:Secreted protein n=1 Tax=Pyxicephalus adspersus TaxID=30357 RepID=A0AAV3BAX0_PYXAD|nr:TPA: hypothetical protein GDO54_001048 [Pyxicephalus adspersus]
MYGVLRPLCLHIIFYTIKQYIVSVILWLGLNYKGQLKCIKTNPHLITYNKSKYEHAQMIFHLWFLGSAPVTREAPVVVDTAGNH